MFREFLVSKKELPAVLKVFSAMLYELTIFSKKQHPDSLMNVYRLNLISYIYSFAYIRVYTYVSLQRVQNTDVHTSNPYL